MEHGNNINTQSHYRGQRTIYSVAEEFNLNSYEFDILKRVMRCRFKSNFLEDLKKTKDVIDIYIKEQGENFK